MTLAKGWNAVFLEVDPVERAPGAVFANVPVDIVARYFTLVTPVQYISDPADEPWKTKGWGVWYAPTREDAFLTSLHAIQGNRCYLIHATAAATWKVTGAVRLQQTSWKTDSFNLFGACIDPAAAPTFGRFFSGAGGRIGSRIYRLVEGKWTKVNQPDATAMRPGEACWVFCSGQTSYQGPLDVTAGGDGGLDFGTTGETLEVAVRNALPATADISVVRVAPSGAGTSLPLNRVRRNLAQLETTYPDLTAPIGFGGVASGGEARVGIQLRRDRMTAAAQSTLLKITSSSGAVAWVPVKASTPGPATAP
ncbi:MAG: hypothetical protein K9N23_07510 [Akkermansiaceae bacterium]|nr:hypothetical protein [Akkermansiaceae bacterium]